MTYLAPLRLTRGVIALALLACPATAGERVTLVGRDTVQLVELDLDTGAVLSGSSVFLPSITPINIGTISAVARVGPETWIGTPDGVLRYGGTPLAYLGHALPGTTVFGLHASQSGAFVQTPGAVVLELDATGALIQTIPFPTLIRDLLPYQGGFLVLTDARIQQTDANLQIQQEFAPGLAAEIAAFNGFPFDPQQIDELSDGRFAFASVAFVVIALADGSLQHFVQAGVFEADVLETGGGMILVPDALGMNLLDPDTLDLVEVRESVMAIWRTSRVSDAYTSPTPPLAGRTCSAGINSTGQGARIHLVGSAEVSDVTLRAAVTSLPPSTFAVPILGSSGFDAAFGNGRLCVSPFTPGLARGPIITASATGSLQVEYDFATPGLGAAFAAGTTWYFQVLYRDGIGSGFNGTDGVFVVFAP